MVKTLEQAIAEVTALPAADQEQTGRKLLAHVEKLREPRRDVRSRDGGEGERLNIKQILPQQ